MGHRDRDCGEINFCVPCGEPGSNDLGRGIFKSQAPRKIPIIKTDNIVLTRSRRAVVERIKNCRAGTMFV